jgi:hypothetical protein
VARAHIKLFFVAKTMHISSEKIASRENIAVTTLTIDKVFAADIGWFIAERIV